MGKRIDTEEGSFRMRRGKLVKIPEEWVGQTLTEQTKRKRRSKQTKAQRAEPHNWLKDGTFDWKNSRKIKNQEIEE